MGPEPDEKCRSNQNQCRGVEGIAWFESFTLIEGQKRCGRHKKNAGQQDAVIENGGNSSQDASVGRSCFFWGPLAS